MIALHFVAVGLFKTCKFAFKINIYWYKITENDKTYFAKPNLQIILPQKFITLLYSLL